MTATSNASPSFAARLDRSFVGVVLVALAIAVIVGTVIFLWWQVSAPPEFSPEKYFPLARGATFTYRVHQPDGSITYRSRNVARQPLNLLLSQLTLNSFSAALAAANIKLDPEQLALAIQQANRFDTARVMEVEYNAAGRTTLQREWFALLTPDRIEQFAVENVGIAPPVPVFPKSNNVEWITGKLNASTPFTATLEIKTRGTYNTDIGKFNDCLQLATTFVFNTDASASRTWYCAGVGEVYDETQDAHGLTRSEILGASVGDFVRGSALVLPHENINAQLESVFPQPITGTITETFQYGLPDPNGRITTNVLAFDEMLLFGTENGALVAVDRGNGQELWRFQTPDAIYSVPVVANGIVYFGSAGRRVYAVRVADGAFLWAFRMKDIISSSPAVRGDSVYVASEDRNLYALDADTGIVRWTFSSSSPFIAQPVVLQDHVFVSNASGDVIALAAATGVKLWEHSAPRAVVAPVTVQNGIVYVGAYSRDLYGTDRNVYALNLQDGQELWSRELGDDVRAEIVVNDSRAFVTLSNDIYALDATNGSTLWRYAGGVTLKGAPVLLGNQVWILRGDAVIALDAQTGTVLNQFSVGDVPVNGGVTSDGRTFYIGYFDGTVKGFGVETP